MFIDYLDPFWPVRSPEPPADRSEKPAREPQQQPVREEPTGEPTRRPEDESYDDRGEQIDEYA
jgi:hypothetical protein